MLPFPLSLLLTPKGAFAALLALLVVAMAVQSLRLDHAKHDLTAARASLATEAASLKASEGLRAAEYRKATAAAGDAETACSARVETALKTGAAIKKIVSKPYATDPTSHCPVRALLGAGELRDAFQPAGPP